MPDRPIHSPLPWEFNEPDGIIEDAAGLWIGAFWQEADIRQVLTAVNYHERLVEALKNCIFEAPDCPSEVDGDPHCFFCGAWLLLDPHEPDCPWVQARDLLAELEG